jgi:glucokinase
VPGQSRLLGIFLAVLVERYEMTPISELVAALDIGGTRYRVALVDRRMRMVARSEGRTLPQEGTKRAIARMAQHLQRMQEEGGKSRIKAVGVAIASPVDPQTGILYAPPNLPAWDGVSLLELFQQHLGLPTFIGNDANLAALGEQQFGAGRGVKELIYLTISTGIGGGVITDGRLLLGSGGLAGELGHITVDRRGARCPCGNTGCVEALASGTAIARIARERLEAGEQSTVLRKVKNLTAEVVFEAASQKDPLAKDIVETAALDLAAAIVSMIHMFNPELIVLGGGIGYSQWPVLAPVVEEYVRRHAMRQFQRDIRFTASALGDDAGLLGAASLAWHGVGSQSRGRGVATRRRRE